MGFIIQGRKIIVWYKIDLRIVKRNFWKLRFVLLMFRYFYSFRLYLFLRNNLGKMLIKLFIWLEMLAWNYKCAYRTSWLLYHLSFNLLCSFLQFHLSMIFQLIWYKDIVVLNTRFIPLFIFLLILGKYKFFRIRIWFWF